MYEKTRNLFLFLNNTLLLYPPLSPYGQTDRRTDRQTEERIYPGYAGPPDGVLQVYPGCADRTLTGSSRLIDFLHLLGIGSFTSSYR